MPIKDLSDIRRMPRLGKVRLGIKVEVPGKNPYPRATDFFVVPDEIKSIVGEEPKKLSIMFPTENPDQFAQQWLRCYSFTQGLICKGDGVQAVRKVDVDTGKIASHTTEKWIRKDCKCDPEHCEQYLSKQCRRVMNLLFLMPEVPGIGVWQLDTTSFYSIVNINSCLALDGLIKKLCGRISFIPLVLSLEPQVVEPEGIKKKTVNILHVRSEAKLIEIQRMGRIPPERILLPELDEDEVPGDLIPEQVIADAETNKEAKGKPVLDMKPEDITEGDVPNMNAVVRLCLAFWEMEEVELCRQLGHRTMTELNNSNTTPWEAWLMIRELKQPQKPRAPEPEPEPVPEPASPEQESETLWPEDMPPLGEDEVQPEQVSEPTPQLEPETKGFLDTNWLKDQLKTLRAKKPTAWSESNILSYIRTSYKVEAKTVLEAVAKLTEGQAAHFRRWIQEALPMI